MAPGSCASSACSRGKLSATVSGTWESARIYESRHTTKRNRPRSLGRARGVALRAAEKALFGPFCPPYSGRIHVRSVAHTLFGQFQKAHSRKSISSIVHSPGPTGQAIRRFGLRYRTGPMHRATRLDRYSPLCMVCSNHYQCLYEHDLYLLLVHCGFSDDARGLQPEEPPEPSSALLLPRLF
jgi:hypothetical protein